MPWNKEYYKNQSARSARAIPIKEALQNLFKEYHLDDKLKEKKLIHSWGRIMGKTVAARTGKVYIKDNVLFVYLTSAPLRNELTLSKDKVMELLEKESGKGIIDDISFR